jgi:hypothetical protein
MLQAMTKKIRWWQAAEILGISDQHMRRWRERYVEEGYNGLLDRPAGPALAASGAGGDGGESVRLVSPLLAAAISPSGFRRYESRQTAE